MSNNIWYTVRNICVTVIKIYLTNIPITAYYKLGRLHAGVGSMICLS